MTAALKDMKVSDDHITEDMTENAPTKDAYPLTMVIYAMVPTGGIPKKTAAKIAQWLDFVADQGQQPGYNPGELPPGYLPLTSAMRAQTLKAAKEVLDQSGNATPSKSTSASASPVPSASPSSSPSSISLGYVSNPLTSGVTKYAIPILLVVGGLLALAGAFALVIGRSGAAVVVRLRRFRLAQLRLPKRSKS
jgi:hypothetical protein